MPRLESLKEKARIFWKREKAVSEEVEDLLEWKKSEPRRKIYYQYRISCTDDNKIFTTHFTPNPEVIDKIPDNKLVKYDGGKSRKMAPGDRVNKYFYKGNWMSVIHAEHADQLKAGTKTDGGVKSYNGLPVFHVYGIYSHQPEELEETKN